VYQLEEYRLQQAFDRDFPAAATTRPVVIWEGHTTSGVSQLEEYRSQRAFDRDFPAAATRPVAIREGPTGPAHAGRHAL